jgi:hypothetical protein
MIESIPARFELCLDHGGKFIGHLLNQTQTKARQGPGRQIPHGFLIPRKVTAVYLGKSIKVIGIVSKPLRILPEYYRVKRKIRGTFILHDPPAFVTGGQMPRTITVVTITNERNPGSKEEEESDPEPTPEPAAEAYEAGAYLCIEAKYTAIPYDDEPIIWHPPSWRPSTVFTKALQFERVIRRDELPEYFDLVRPEQIQPNDDSIIAPE